VECASSGVCQKWSVPEVECARSGVCQKWSVPEVECARSGVCQGRGFRQWVSSISVGPYLLPYLLIVGTGLLPY
jgi:hypothetical protein